MKTNDLREQLKAGFLIDPDTDLVKEQFAVVYTRNGKRKRFPENCIEIKASEEEAIEGSKGEKNLRPAIVYGPCRSSEGLRLYYLVEWLS
jgi:hypothetical protein